MDSPAANPQARVGHSRVSRFRLSGTDGLALVVYAGAALALGFADFAMRRYPARVVTDYIPGVVDGTYGAPAIYRVLAPFSIQYFASWTGLDPLLAFLFTRLLWIYAALIALHAYLRVWYSANASLAGGLAVAAFLPLTFTNSWAHPDSFPELCLMTLGCLATVRVRDNLLYPILLLATLNRETAAFLVLFWAAVRLGTMPAATFAWRLGSYAAVWGVVYGGLRVWRGLQHYQYWMLDQNLAVLKILPPGFDPYTRVVGYLGLVFLIIPTWLAIKGLRMPNTPATFGRALPVAGLFVVIAFLFSAVAESRIFLPVVPLVLPAALRAIVEPEAASERDAALASP